MNHCRVMTQAAKHLATAGAVCLLALTACTPTLYGRSESDRETESRLKERRLGTIRFDGIQRDDADHEIRLVKIHKGYALKSGLHESARSRSDFVLSKDKEKDWFAGIQMRWSVDF